MKFASAVAVLMLSSACVSSEPTREPAASESLKPVRLPDLSGASEPVARQVREGYGALMTMVESPGGDAARRANAYGDFGQLLLAAKFPDEAESCFLHAQALAPEDPRWPYYLGHVYLTRLDRPRAAASFERALQIAPADLPALLWLGEINLDEGRPDAAASIFKRALATASHSAAASYGAGRAAMMQETHAEAVKYFEQALVNDPQASAVHYPLAMAYRALGNRERAETHLRQRGEARPGWADPLLEQVDQRLANVVSFEQEGVRALQAQDWTAAANAFRKGLELQPDDAALRHRLGTALFSAGDTAGAEQEFREVLRRSPNFAKAHVSLGVVLNTKGRYREAIEQFSSAVDDDQGSPEAHHALAETLRATGQLQASMPHYEAAIRLDPSNADPWIGGARALIRLKEYAKARAWLSEARRVHPERRELEELQKGLLEP